MTGPAEKDFSNGSPDYKRFQMARTAVTPYKFTAAAQKFHAGRGRENKLKKTKIVGDFFRAWTIVNQQLNDRKYSGVL
jgi:hypothetical protein